MMEILELEKKMMQAYKDTMTLMRKANLSPMMAVALLECMKADILANKVIIKDGKTEPLDQPPIDSDLRKL